MEKTFLRAVVPVLVAVCFSNACVACKVNKWLEFSEPRGELNHPLCACLPSERRERGEADLQPEVHPEPAPLGTRRLEGSSPTFQPDGRTAQGGWEEFLLVGTLFPQPLSVDERPWGAERGTWAPAELSFGASKGGGARLRGKTLWEMGAPELFAPSQEEREGARTWETHFSK